MEEKKYIPNIPEQSAISFPLRKILQRECNVHFRVAEMLELSEQTKEIRTNIGYLKYDYLTLAMGTNPNFFGHVNIAEKTLPMKSAADAILIRNITRSAQTQNFKYKDKGSLATIGRNLAVADLRWVKLKGFLAWVRWSIVYLFAIVNNLIDHPYEKTSPESVIYERSKKIS